MDDAEEHATGGRTIGTGTFMYEAAIVHIHSLDIVVTIFAHEHGTDPVGLATTVADRVEAAGCGSVTDLQPDGLGLPSRHRRLLTDGPVGAYGAGLLTRNAVSVGWGPGDNGLGIWSIRLGDGDDDVMELIDFVMPDWADEVRDGRVRRAPAVIGSGSDRSFIYWVDGDVLRLIISTMNGGPSMENLAESVRLATATEWRELVEAAPPPRLARGG